MVLDLKFTVNYIRYPPAIKYYLLFFKFANLLNASTLNDSSLSSSLVLSILIITFLFYL